MKKLILAAFVGGLMAVGLTWLLSPKSQSVSSSTPDAQPAFARVISNRTLRCAYASYDPFLIVDPANGTKSGIFHDVLEEAGKRLNLKIEWAEEVGYGNINTGFVSGKYDAFCAGLWPAATRSANTVFSRAVVWDPIGVWVRGDESRLNTLSALNDPAYKISDIEGDATDAMADVLFPKAGLVVTTQSQSIPEEIVQVTTKKADALFIDYLSADKFLESNIGQLKDLSPGKPVVTYALTIGFNQGETSLRDMVDVVLDDMDRDGTTGSIVKKYLGDKSNLVYQRIYQYQPY